VRKSHKDQRLEGLGQLQEGELPSSLPQFTPISRTPLLNAKSAYCRHDAKSDDAWMAQAARNMSMVSAEEKSEFQPTHIIRDRDTKFTDHFCSILETDGIDFHPIPPRSPNLNPYAESFVGRTKAECLNHFLVFGEKHLRHILKEWVSYYHTARPHQGLGNVLIDTTLPPPAPLHEFRSEEIVCHESLGGLLKHYERRAA
jgi:putative transposase